MEQNPTTHVPKFCRVTGGASLQTFNTGLHVREYFRFWKDGHCRLGHVDFGLIASSLLLASYFQKDICLEVALKKINEGSKKPYFWRRLII